MKKTVSSILCAALLAPLLGCGGTSTDAVSTTPQPTAAAETERPAETSTPVPTEYATQEEGQGNTGEVSQTIIIDGNTITLKDDGTGQDIDNDEMAKSVVQTTRNINYQGETGPFTYQINSIQLATMTVLEEDYATVLGYNIGDEFTLFAIDLTVENTSDNDLSFYPYMSTIITNTKEQAESNWLISDDVGGDFYGNVEKSGQIYWQIDSPANDITHIQWRVDAPHDSNYDKVGEDIKIEFELLH